MKVKKKQRSIEKIIQIAGDYKIIWVLTNKGNIFKREYFIQHGEFNSSGAWEDWAKEDLPKLNKLKGNTT